MCGRFSLIANIRELEERFGFTAEGFDLGPSFNVAPTQSVITVRAHEVNRVATPMRWGLVPSWAKDISIGNKMINARAETVSERPSFRAAFKRRRCLVLADGFYEWQKVGKSKVPMRIGLKSGEPFAFAGLWEVWKSPDGEDILSCTIITTNANEFMQSIHERMPVILPPDAEEAWTDPEFDDSDGLQALLKPYDPEVMTAYEVSTLVNSPRNNAPEVIEPVRRLL